MKITILLNTNWYVMSHQSYPLLSFTSKNNILTKTGNLWPGIATIWHLIIWYSSHFCVKLNVVQGGSLLTHELFCIFCNMSHNNTQNVPQSVSKTSTVYNKTQLHCLVQFYYVLSDTALLYTAIDSLCVWQALWTKRSSSGSNFCCPMQFLVAWGN